MAKPERKTSTVHDGFTSMTVSFSKSTGLCYKGVIKKNEVVNFNINVSIDNISDQKLFVKKIYANINTGAKRFTVNLKRGSNNFNLRTNEIRGKVNAEVVLVYDIGLMRTTQKVLKTFLNTNLLGDFA